MFGYKQSGHISSVGFEMYCELLKEIKTKKEGGVKEHPIIYVSALAKIPRSYVKKESLRVDYYYQISKATNKEDIDIIINNLEIVLVLCPDEQNY